MVLLEFSIFPLDKGESLSRYVAETLEIIDAAGLPYQCHSMGTVLEGQFDEVMDVVRQCYQRMSADCDRVELSLKLDYRKGRRGGLRSKVAAVEEKLGRQVKK